MECDGVKRWKVMVFTQALELFELGSLRTCIHTLQTFAVPRTAGIAGRQIHTHNHKGHMLGNFTVRVFWSGVTLRVCSS